MNERSPTFYYLPPVLWAGAIYLGSASSSLSTLPAFLPPYADKVAHAAEYFILAMLLARALAHAPALLAQRAWLLTIAAAAAYALSDELHQLFVSGRTADFFDWLADTIGAAVGGWAYLVFLRSAGHRC